MKKTKRVKKRDLKSPDLSVFSDVLFPKEEKKETMNKDFLIEELKKRRPLKDAEPKEKIATIEPCASKSHYCPQYLKIPTEEKKNCSQKSDFLPTPRASTRAVTSRSGINDSTRFLSVSCFGSPDVVPYQMQQRNIPEMRRSMRMSKSSLRAKPAKHVTTARSLKTPMFSWKYCGEANDNIGVYTARVPLHSGAEQKAEAEAQIETVRRVMVAEKKKAVRPRDLFSMSIKQRDEYIPGERSYKIDYESGIADDVIADDSTQTFLVCDDKMIPLKVSILR